MKNKPRRRHPQKPILSGPIHEFSVEDLSHEAKGVARLDGKVTFIEGALPGEVVSAQIFKQNKSFNLAKLKSIIQASPSRIAPPCPHFQQCGGCSFQHLNAKEQQQTKHRWLSKQLRKVLHTVTLEILIDQDMAYRRRARLAITYRNGRVSLGFRGKGSSEIVDISTCLVLTPRLQSLYTQLRVSLLQDVLAAKMGHIELLEDSRGTCMVMRLTADISAQEQQRWQHWATEHDTLIYWQYPRDKQADATKHGLRSYTIEGFSLHFHPQDFIQINAKMNEKMVAQALQWLAPNKDDVILDLFCGVGNFSLPLAKQAKTVVGVEIQESMVAAGKQNAQLNNLNNLKFIAADLTQKVGSEISALGVSKVMIDPPRAGAYEFLPTLVALNPQQILYVSCDGATLARDAEYLAEYDYRITKACMMDMFPQTAHLECMLLFERV
ncbi:MAG: 23S rRNA (uracil(1939)-C(5))-methyltransferase RlmD [Paraglaciecola sp.]|nr:23S rRNA (uracil(1939)-C(5))-methyltransferase RlmD [Paraglaciecola sp.]NCT48439.1 23S rRNA (uracil(1939)-C(5))-methyltransferase RlmD [Paraglaciecola sp.]